MLLALSISQVTTAHPCEETYWFEYIASPDACYKYYTCLLGSFDSERTCDDGTVFDPAQKYCVPGYQETCEIFVNPTTTQRSTAATSTPPVNPCGTGRWRTTVAHPDNCYQYYSCIPMSRSTYTNVPVLGNCPDGNVFNPKANGQELNPGLSICVPGDQETCEIFGETATET